jgi:hypothetical protein
MSTTTPYQIVVIPKGLAQGGRLKLTLSVVPSESHAGVRNLPALLRASTGVTLQVKGLPRPEPTAPIPDDVRANLSPQLWNELFGQAQPGPTRAARHVKTQAYEAGGAAAAVYMYASSLGGAMIQTRNKVRMAGGAQQVRAPVKIRDLPRGQFKSDTAGAFLGNALDAVDQHFLRPGPSLTELMEDLAEPGVSQNTDNTWLDNVLGGYESPAKKAVGAPVDIFRELGLKKQARDFLRARLTGEGFASYGGKGVAECALTSAYVDTMLATAPYNPRMAVQTVDKDQTSFANVLAAVGQEFAIHPFLGMSIDITVPLSDEGARAVAGDMASISAKVAGLIAETPWTAVGHDGFARVRGGGAGAHNSIPIAPGGRFALGKDAYFSNADVPSNVTKLLGALLESRDKSDPAVRGAQAGEAELVAAGLRTGPVILHLHGQATRAAARAGHAAAAPGDLHLEDLVIGVRPDLKVARPDTQGKWRSLLGRKVVYAARPDCGLGDATCHSDASRMEGFIPLDRLEYRGEDTQQEETVVKDQLFEWSGWNPAVPMPGSGTEEDLRDKLKKTITAVPGTNPRYRYGWMVEASLRQVLRDGSSVALTEDALQEASLAIQRKPADQTNIIASLGLDCEVMQPGVDRKALFQAQGLRPFAIKRFEPMAAPVAMFGGEADLSGRSDTQSAARVVLDLSRPVHATVISATRFIIPGAIRDVFELDRHGVFDAPSNATPRSTAFAGYARSSVALEIFPSREAQGVKQPVLVRAAMGARFDASKNYYPDPLVKALRLVLVRKNKAQETFALHESGMVCEYVHPLYEGTRWPDAAALQVDFVPMARGGAPARAAISGARGRAVVQVPHGEAFDLLVLPVGETAELEAKHALGKVAPHDSPLVSEALTIHVESWMPAAYAPHIPAEPVGAARTMGSKSVRFANLIGGFDPATTAELELVASWTDPFDNPAMGLPSSMRPVDPDRRAEMIAGVLSEDVRRIVDEGITSSATSTPLRRPIAIDLAGLSHEFMDTKHRVVHYWLRAANANGAKDAQARRWVVSQEPRTVSWLSTAKPEPARIVEATPSFRFDRDEKLLHSRSTREVAVTLFLDRGWDCSSGPGELLGIRCGDSASHWDDAVSSWGADPLRLTQPLPRKHLTLGDIGDSPQRLQLTQLPKTGADGVARLEKLALFRPVFDMHEKLWRVDVVVHVPHLVAQPFIKLVAVRFQPNALEGAMVSENTIADFVQLPSRRTATVIGAYRGDPTQLYVSVAGPRGAGSDESGKPEIVAQLLFAETAGHGKVTWMPDGATHSLKPVGAPEHLVERWETVITLSAQMRRHRIGVRIGERTVYLRDDRTRDPSGPTAYGELQYSDVLVLKVFEGNGPSGPSQP